MGKWFQNGTTTPREFRGRLVAKSFCVAVALAFGLPSPSALGSGDLSKTTKGVSPGIRTTFEAGLVYQDSVHRDKAML